MIDSTKSTVHEFGPTLAPAEVRPQPMDALADRRSWEASEGRLHAEFRKQLEQNSPVAMTVSPRVLGEVWRYAAYVAEREGVDLHAAVAHLMELGVQADSPNTRQRAQAEIAV